MLSHWMRSMDRVRRGRRSDDACGMGVRRGPVDPELELRGERREQEAREEQGGVGDDEVGMQGESSPMPTEGSGRDSQGGPQALEERLCERR